MSHRETCKLIDLMDRLAAVIEQVGREVVRGDWLEEEIASIRAELHRLREMPPLDRGLEEK